MTLPDFVLQISLLLAVAVVIGVLARRVRVPLTALLTMIGFLAAWAGDAVGIGSPVHGEEFEEVLVFIFLPVLIFAAALGLSTRSFLRNLGPILVLATVAVGVSAILVALTLHFALGTPLAAALLFGALISATDPVAVVAVFRELGVPQRVLTLVEGESLLNDGVAIVLFSILLTAALGGTVTPVGGVVDFVRVFFGGAVIGLLIGLGAAFVLPWLDRFLAAALSVAVAYGGFVLADHVLGFSGVMATVGSGLVLGGLAPSRASEAVREAWHQLWEALDYIANALLFLLIGLAIDPGLMVHNLGAIGLAIVAVLVARAAGVIPLVRLLERFAGIPRVGRRNEAVLVWGGLRGGVALALALALADELAEREMFIAMTGGVVLATLLINATTIGPLVRRLRLGEPTRADRFLAGSARLSAVAAARQELAELGLDDQAVQTGLDAAEASARGELERIHLDRDEEAAVVTRRGLFVERETYQRLSDAGVLPPSTTRTLLHDVDDQIEEVGLRPTSRRTAEHRGDPFFDRLFQRFVGWLPGPMGADPTELAYAEANARRLAARRTGEALELLGRLPNIHPESVRDAKQTFSRWEQEALAELTELDQRVGEESRELRRRQADTIARVASEDALDELARVGLLAEVVAHRAAEAVAAEVDQESRG